FFDGYLYADIFFGNAQFFFYAQFYRQSMSIPTRLPFHTESLHRLIAAYQVFEGTGDHMMDPGHTVGARRSFIKYERPVCRALLYGFLKYFFFLPTLQKRLLNGRHIQIFIFPVFFRHKLSPKLKKIAAKLTNKMLK